jgi:lipopolysaccharide export system permease protein
MSTVRNYLAKEIYRSTLVVMVALIGLFSFFTLVDQLDSLTDAFPLSSLLYLELLALPTRLYELLPIGLLIGAILALAGLAQRNELVILRVSGVSAKRLLGMLWMIAVPIILLAIVISEIITPAAEIRYSEANLVMRGRAEGGRLVSGYWFKEPTKTGGYRVINISRLLGSGEVADLSLYEFADGSTMSALVQARRGVFIDGQLKLSDVTEYALPADALEALAQAQAREDPLLVMRQEPERAIATTLTPARLAARISMPERMSLAALWDFVQYMQSNQLDATRQMVAIWRKLAYPFTLIVMMTIAAPISYMQTRRGGIGAKIFIGILVGTTFFMVNQLTLNVGMLYNWKPTVTALLPNTIAFLFAMLAVLGMERRLGPKEKTIKTPRKALPA